jgi:hypothetical protein
MERARHGTGVFLKLNKKSYETRIRLTPCSADHMRVHFRIGGDNHYFYPSCVQGDQFSSFLTAVYCLYNEGYEYHYLHNRQWKRRFGVEPWEYPWEDGKENYYKSIPIAWDEEGRIIEVTVSRRSVTEEVFRAGVPDPIKVEFNYSNKHYQYEVDGRELCYAIARGYTEAIKKYGFQGYLRSSGLQYIGDYFEIEELLFVKAYALDAMVVRELTEAWRKPRGWTSAKSSSFEKELKLLLFDM